MTWRLRSKNRLLTGRHSATAFGYPGGALMPLFLIERYLAEKLQTEPETVGTIRADQKTECRLLLPHR